MPAYQDDVGFVNKATQDILINNNNNGYITSQVVAAGSRQSMLAKRYKYTLIRLRMEIDTSGDDHDSLSLVCVFVCVSRIVFTKEILLQSYE